MFINIKSLLDRFGVWIVMMISPYGKNKRIQQKLEQE